MEITVPAFPDSELTDKSGEVQVSSLIYSMGPEAEKIFTQFGLADAEANDFHTCLLYTSPSPRDTA